MSRPATALLDPRRYPFAHRITTRFADIDPNQHLNNVALAAMMEDARIRFNLEINGQIKLGQRRAMIASFAIEYLAQGHFPDPVTVHCAIEAVGRSSWTIIQLLAQHSGSVAFARSVIVAIAADRPVPVDEAFRALLLERWTLK